MQVHVTCMRNDNDWVEKMDSGSCDLSHDQWPIQIVDWSGQDKLKAWTTVSTGMQGVFRWGAFYY